jgi:hypothetical protein
VTPKSDPKIAKLQRAINKRAKARNLPTVTVDGQLGPITITNGRHVARALGIVLHKPGLSASTRRVIIRPALRTPAQLLRAAKWTKAQKTEPLRLRALAEARKKIGTMEHGSNNRGTAVEQIIHYANGQDPEPWCVDFVIWSYGHAGSKIIKPGYPRAVSWMHTPGTVTTTSPQPGDVVRYTFDHTGLFVKDNGDGTITTIEGNTSSSGAVSDSTTGGDGVYEKIRFKSLVHDYLHVQS